MSIKEKILSTVSIISILVFSIACGGGGGGSADGVVNSDNPFLAGDTSSQPKDTTDTSTSDNTTTTTTTTTTTSTTTTTTSAPSAPSGVSATAGDANAIINFSGSSDASSYNLYYDTSSGVSPTSPSANKITNFTSGSSIPSLTNGTKYFIVITAINSSSQESDASSEVEVTPVVATTAPSAPTLSASAGDASVSLSWNNVGASNYTVYQGTALTGSIVGKTNLGTVTSTSFNVTSGVTNGTQYFYIITANNSAGSTASNEANATPAATVVAPTAPTLSATAGDTQVNLSWNNVGATSYTVYQGTSATSSIVGKTNLGSVTSTSFSVTSGITNGTQYFYMITANNSAGSTNSNEVNATPTATVVAPTAPTLSATAGDTQVNLSWNNVGATSYTVYQGTSATSSIVGKVNLGSVTSTSFSVTSGITNGTQYFFIVVATNSAGSTNSNEVNATPSAVVTAPNQPGPLTATPGDSSVNLSWPALSGSAADNIIIYFTTTGTPPTTASANVQVSGANTVALHTSLINGTTYDYAITAINSAGESAASSNVSARPNVSLSAPSPLTATAGDTQVDLSWPLITGADNFIVYYSTSLPVTTANANLQVSGSSNTVSHTGLTNGTTYNYNITALNNIGESSASSTVNATPVAPLSAPVTAANVILFSGNTHVSLKWHDAGDADSFHIFHNTTNSFDFTGANIEVSGGNTYDHMGLTDGTEYFYSIIAKNTAGLSTNTMVDSATPLSAPVISSANGFSASANLDWNDVTGATSYSIYFANSSGVTSSSANSIDHSAGSNLTITGLTDDTMYYYVVTAKTSNGESLISNEVSVYPTSSVPAAPTVSASGGNTDVTLSWDVVPSANVYEIYYATDGAGVDATNDFLALISTNTYLHTSLTNGNTYYYGVRAYNHIGASGFAQANATPNVIPAAPSGLVAVAGAGNVALSWTASANTTQYNIYFANSTGVTSASSNVVTSATNTYVHTGLDHTLTYFYVVSAQNGAGESATTSEASASPVLAIPSVPTIASVATGSTNIFITWGDVTGATSYTVYYGTTTGLTTASNPTGNGTSTTFDLDGRTSGEVFFLAVSATNAAGTSALSTEVVKQVNGNWTPASISLNLWLDASDNTTFTGGPSGNIAVWQDKSGNGDHVSQDTAVAQPHLIQGVVNSLPAVRFDGAGDYINGGNLATGLNESTIITVINRKTINGLDTLLATDGNWGAGKLHVITASGEKYNNFSPHNGQGNGVTNQVENTWTINGFVHSSVSGNVKHFNDGALDVDRTFTSGVVTAYDLDAFNIGAWDNNGSLVRHLDADIAEFIIKESAMTDTERILLEGYLSFKWGLESNLPSSHPSKLSAP